MKAILDFEPCDKCKNFMEQGITLVGVTTVKPDNGIPSIGDGLYPSGAWSVIKEDSDFCQQLLDAEPEERKETIKGVAKKAGAAAGVAVVGVGGKIANKVLQDTERDLVKKGVKVIEAAAKKIIK